MVVKHEKNRQAARYKNHCVGYYFCYIYHSNLLLLSYHFFITRISPENKSAYPTICCHTILCGGMISGIIFPATNSNSTAKPLYIAQITVLLEASAGSDWIDKAVNSTPPHISRPVIKPENHTPPGASPKAEQHVQYQIMRNVHAGFPFKDGGLRLYPAAAIGS